MGKTRDDDAPEDYHNRKLWKRKQHREHKVKDERKKKFREFRKVQADEEGGQEAIKAEVTEK